MTSTDVLFFGPQENRYYYSKVRSAERLVINLGRR